MRAGRTQSPDLILGCHPSSLGLGMTWGAGSRTQELQALQSKCSKCGLGNLGVNSNSVPPPIQSYEMPTSLVTPAWGSTGHLWDQEWSFLALRSCWSLILRLSENREQKNNVYLGCRGQLATQTPRGQLGQVGKAPRQGTSVFWCWGGAVTCLCGPRVIMWPPVVHLGCLAPEDSQRAKASMAVSVEGGGLSGAHSSRGTLVPVPCQAPWGNGGAQGTVLPLRGQMSRWEDEGRGKRLGLRCCRRPCRQTSKPPGRAATLATMLGHPSPL